MTRIAPRVAICGMPGTGKSAVAAALLGKLGSKGRVVKAFLTPLDRAKVKTLAYLTNASDLLTLVRIMVTADVAACSNRRDTGFLIHDRGCDDTLALGKLYLSKHNSINTTERAEIDGLLQRMIPFLADQVIHLFGKFDIVLKRNLERDERTHSYSKRASVSNYLEIMQKSYDHYFFQYQSAISFDVERLNVNQISEEVSRLMRQRYVP